MTETFPDPLGGAKPHPLDVNSLRHRLSRMESLIRQMPDGEMREVVIGLYEMTRDVVEALESRN